MFLSNYYLNILYFFLFHLIHQSQTHDPTTKIKHDLKPHQYQHKNQYNNNKQYPVLSRVRELGLLEQTAQLGLLSKLEKQGLTLEKAEELLPLLEDLGLLSLVANNQQLLINGLAPVAVEGAPLLLPLVAGALDVGAPAFFLGAAGFAGLDAFLFANGVEVPFIGLPAGAVLGLVLIPLAVALGGVGVAIGSLKK